MDRTSSIDWRVLVVAPFGTDAANTVELLKRARFSAEACRTVADAASEASAGCAAMVLTEESLEAHQSEQLAAWLGRQPAWSNLPIVMIVSSSRSTRAHPPLRIGDRTLFWLLERPLRIATLVSAVEVALSTRRQQYEIRDLLDERSKLLESLEQRVEERTAKLKAMVSEMESFSYSVSHDLRSPLRVLAGYARVLLEDYSENLPAEARGFLEKISHAAQRMDRLTQDLLAYTRIASRELPLEPVNLDEVLAGVIDDYPMLQECRERIHVKNPLGWVKGHGPSLVQCFSNLLENALKFAKPGAPAAIEVSSTRCDGVCRISVADNGVGIEARHLNRIFELFERVSDERSPGTGIGLAIVKKATERMLGTVGVESTPGKGTVFWIELPVAEKNEHKP